MTTSIKIVFREEIRRVPSTLVEGEWPEVCHRLREVLQHSLRGLEDGKGPHRLVYRDVDGDEITVQSAQELREAALCIPEGVVLKLRVVRNAALRRMLRGDGEEVAPTSTDATGNGLAEMMRGSYEQVRDGLKAALAQGGDPSMLWYKLSCVESLQGNAEAALDALKQAAESGYNDFKKMKTDPHLVHMRTTLQAEFNAFLTELWTAIESGKRRMAAATEASQPATPPQQSEEQVPRTQQKGAQKQLEDWGQWMQSVLTEGSTEVASHLESFLQELQPSVDHFLQTWVPNNRHTTTTTAVAEEQPPAPQQPTTQEEAPAAPAEPQAVPTEADVPADPVSLQALLDMGFGPRETLVQRLRDHNGDVNAVIQSLVE